MSLFSQLVTVLERIANALEQMEGSRPVPADHRATPARSNKRRQYSSRPVADSMKLKASARGGR